MKQFEKDQETTELLAIFDGAPIVMILLDEKYRIRRSNLAAGKRFGRDRQEFDGLRPGDALQCINALKNPEGCGSAPGCGTCGVRTAILNTFREGRYYHRTEVSMCHVCDKEPVEVAFLISTAPIETVNGLRVLVSLEDITELRKAEKALRTSEERYVLAQKAANIGSWDWDVFTGELEWSDQIEPMFGFGPGEFGKTYESFLECVHPADRQFVDDSVKAALEGAAEYDIEHRIVLPDGSIRWLTERGDVFRDGEGKPSRMLGVVRDITDRKHFEDRQKLATRILTLLNQPDHQKDLLRKILLLIKEHTGMEAAGIRLHQEGDYPYYLIQGFPSQFVELESSLCSRDRSGGFKRDEGGNLVLECMCGNVIRGRTDPAMPFFTKGGSFWTNSTTDLLKSTSEEDRQSKTRNRCNSQGYESVAIIPLSSAGTIIGTLQLNDSRRDMFTLELVEYLQELGESIGIALNRRRAEESLLKRTEELSKRVRELNCLYSITTLVDQIGISFEEIIEKTVLLIPAAWQFPDIACARIRLGEAEYKSESFRETRWKQDCPIITHGQEAGSIEVFYMEERPPAAEGPFLYEERRLISAIAETLGVIIEKTQMEQALKSSEQNYRTLVESSPDGIITLDARGYIKHYNNGVSQLLGYGPEELVGRNIREIVAQSIPANLFSYYVRQTENEQLENEFQMIGSLNEVLPMWAKIVPVTSSEDRFRELIIYLRDITERKRIDQLKDDFIGLVSHELRNPLTILIGAINTAQSERDRLSPEEVNQLLSDAALEAESLSHLIGNLLELSRSQSHRLLLYPEPINIGTLAGQATEKIHRQFPCHDFDLDTPENLPLVRADQLRVERILYNLLENAAKYSPEGSRIRLSFEPEESRVVVCVQDEGAGMTPEEEDAVFDPFHRLQQHQNAGVTGLGLGLSVCKHLVEAHGGQIWVESSLGGGTSFFFTLPVS